MITQGQIVTCRRDLALFYSHTRRGKRTFLQPHKLCPAAAPGGDNTHHIERLGHTLPLFLGHGMTMGKNLRRGGFFIPRSAA